MTYLTMLSYYATYFASYGALAAQTLDGMLARKTSTQHSEGGCRDQSNHCRHRRFTSAFDAKHGT